MDTEQIYMYDTDQEYINQKRFKNYMLKNK